MKRLRSLLSWPAALVGLLVLRCPRSWAFVMDRHQDFEGNLRTLAQHLLRRGDCQVYLLNHRRSFNEKLIADCPGLILVQGGSWQEFRTRLLCRQVVISHGFNSVLGIYRRLTGVRLINVWHGIPVKAMGNLNPSEAEDAGNLSSIAAGNRLLHTFTVSSELERTMMAGCFLLDAQKIRVTGIPRTDVLLSADKRDKRQKEIIEDIERIKGGRRLVLYAPTFRDYDRAALGFTRAEMERINALAGQEGFLFGIRVHPRERDLYRELSANLEHIISADAGRWEDANTVLCATDLLISDYSSIWIEYLLLERPVCAYLWDEEAYRSRRAFLLELSSVLPGPVVRDATQLIEALRKFARSRFALAEYAEQHARARALFHQHRDGRSCERIYDAAMAD
jgi:CDP-glycerol glycerophosphotransferase (TagB/SpsB family)